MSHHSIRCSLLLAAFVSAAVALSGCRSTDPMYKDGEWHPSGANETNLAAMVENPNDLIHGVDTAPVDGQQAAAAVARLRQGNVKHLPDSGLAEIRVQTGDNQAGPGAPGTGGN